MTKTEIRNKFDEIVNFSGCELYIDTPIKRYSSGMYVRLAFAVAAHLEPEILIVDEVLAVGDAEFQKKAIGKMQDVSAKEGRTVLFVSHNMIAVKNLCKSGILLQNGVIKFSGKTESVVNYYLSDETAKGIVNNEWNFEDAPGTEFIRVRSAYIKYANTFVTVNEPFDLITEFWCLKQGFQMNVSTHIYDNNSSCVFNISTINKPLEKGLHRAIFHIPAGLMNDGVYYVDNMFVTNSSCHFLHQHSNSFEINEDRITSMWHGKWIGAVRPTFIENELLFMG
jgi:lipopolysaccharide transport system ATP-binding protein